MCVCVCVCGVLCGVKFEESCDRGSVRYREMCWCVIQCNEWGTGCVCLYCCVCVCCSLCWWSMVCECNNQMCHYVSPRLWGCFLTEKSCAALASAARSTSCSLKQLNLRNNKIHDAGVQHLSDLLKYPHCKLETLEWVLIHYNRAVCVLKHALHNNIFNLHNL